MRVFLACTLGSALMISAQTASAQDFDSIEVQTEVEVFCSELPNSNAPLHLGELINGNGWAIESFGAGVAYTAEGYYCNAPVEITLAAAPLMRTPSIANPDTSSFTDRIDYLATLTWSDVTHSVSSTDGNPSPHPISQPKIGTLSLSLSAPDTSGLRPLAGDYGALVTLSIAAK